MTPSIGDTVVVKHGASMMNTNGVPKSLVERMEGHDYTVRMVTGGQSYALVGKWWLFPVCLFDIKAVVAPDIQPS